MKPRNTRLKVAGLSDTGRQSLIMLHAILETNLITLQTLSLAPEPSSSQLTKTCSIE